MTRKRWLLALGVLLALALAAAAVLLLPRTPSPPHPVTPSPILPRSPSPTPTPTLSQTPSPPPTADWGALPTVTPLPPDQPTIPLEAQDMRAAPTATPGEPPPPPPTSTPTSYPTPRPTPTPAASTGHDDVPMVEIPAGEFIMGSTFDDAAYRGWIYAEEKRDWLASPDRFNDEIPQMTVSLDVFEIDEVEVTNARYRRCVETGICRPVSNLGVELPEGYATDPRYDDYPALGVSWFDAYSYCQWVDKRLPTEAEWEKAARGTDGRRYPWGNEWEPTYGAFGSELASVGSFPQDTSPYGALDMAGNAGEWTLGIYRGYLGIGQLGIGYTPAFRVARGHDIDDLFQLSSRSPDLPGNAAYGFRCVRGGPPMNLEQVVVSTSVPRVPSTPAAVDLSGMAYIPAGEFIMGTDEIYDPEDAHAHRDEQPAHVVYLDAYYIDRYPVTYAQFVEFLNALGTHRGACSGAPCALVVEEWEEESPMTLRIYRRDGRYVIEERYENYPVQNTTWEGAQVYCAWLGKRLPTEAEWEKAGRGTDGRRYPWGNEWDERIEEIYDHEIGQYPFDASPYGLHDLIGNGYGEYVADWYDPVYYGYSPYRNPVGPESGEYKVTRGGGGVHAIWGVTSREIDNGGGFRCAYGPTTESAP